MDRQEKSYIRVDVRIKLNELRTKHNFTQEQLADLSGVPKGTVGSILSGKSQEPNFNAVCAMVIAMGESVDELYTGVPRRQEVQPAAPAPDAAAKVVKPKAAPPSQMQLLEEMKNIAVKAIAQVTEQDTYKRMEIQHQKEIDRMEAQYQKELERMEAQHQKHLDRLEATYARELRLLVGSTAGQIQR